MRYHDLAAEHYDSKWGIGYDEVGQAQVTGKLRKALGPGLLPAGGFARALEIGAGTGYFTLNLLRAGVIRSGVASDISPGMLRALSASADGAGADGRDRRLRGVGAAVRGRQRSTSSSATPCCTTCPTWPAPSASSGACCARAAWSPSAASRRATATASRRCRSAARWRWRRCGARCSGRSSRNGNGARAGAEEDRLEQVVDVHAFTPGGPVAPRRRGRASLDVRVGGEELAASLFGWANRTLEATAEPSEVPWAWRVYAYRGYLLLQRLDRSLLEPRLPAALFYNLLVSARAPALGRTAARTGRRPPHRSRSS